MNRFTRLTAGGLCYSRFAKRWLKFGAGPS